jgi:hypothetical protein
LMSAVPEPINFQTGRREKRGVFTAIAIGIMAILETSAASAHMASSSYGSYDKAFAFACYTCFTRTPSERTLRQSHPPTYEPPTVRYTPATRTHTPIAITLPPWRNTAVRTPNNTMVMDGGLLEDIRRNGRVREQQRILQQAGRDAEELEHTPGH